MENRISAAEKLTMFANRAAAVKRVIDADDTKHCFTGVEVAMAEYGAENIIMLICEDHNRYSDSDTYFHYYNLVTDEIFEDVWSTRFAAPDYSRYSALTIWEAQELGIDLTKIYNHYINTVRENVKHIAKFVSVIDYRFAPVLGRKVKVTGGRKFKGEGVLVDIRKQTFSTGWSTKTTSVAVIYDPEKNVVGEASLAQVTYNDCDEVERQYMDWANGIIDAAIADGIDGIVKYMPSFYTGNPQHTGAYCLDTFYEKFVSVPDYSCAKYPEQEARREKLMVKVRDTHTRLVAWAEKFTDKTQEEKDFMVRRSLEKQFPEWDGKF